MFVKYKQCFGCSRILGSLSEVTDWPHRAPGGQQGGGAGEIGFGLLLLTCARVAFSACARYASPMLARKWGASVAARRPRCARATASFSAAGVRGSEFFAKNANPWRAPPAERWCPAVCTRTCTSFGSHFLSALLPWLSDLGRYTGCTRAIVRRRPKIQLDFFFVRCWRKDLLLQRITFVYNIC